MIVFDFFVSFHVIEAIEKNIPLTINAITNTVPKMAVVVASVMSWKNHITVGFSFDFLIHMTL